MLAVAFWSTIGVSAVAAYRLVSDLPTRDSIGSSITQMARSSVLYDVKGRPAFTIFKEQRIEVPLERMSPNLKNAILAVEDQRFYEHRGVDIVRIVGAAVANLRRGTRAQGGSTITQQLARLSLLSPEKTYTRKLQEVLLAALIEREYTKDQILELYLNRAYFGAGLYGAEAASLGYFGKHASELTIAEAALLAGLVKAPSNYAPTTNVDRAIQRRNLVLDIMHDVGMIDEDELKEAKRTKVVLTDALRKDEPYGRYFKEAVRLELIARFGEERVYEGGLKVFTTIDLDIQRAADEEVRKALAALDKRKSRDAVGELQAALVAIDPNNGEVRALVGGRDFNSSHYNRALQAKRQPGSAFKPFVYAAALEAGFTPASLISNLLDPIATPQGDWIPEDDHNDAEAMTMRAALKSSSNRAAVRMLQDLGIRKAVDYAARVGVPNMPSVPSLALGAGEVTLEALTTAYSVFAAGGLRRQPVYIKRVEDQDGKVLYEAPYVSEQVISPETAFLMTSMMADVINSGTAYGVRQAGFKLPAAGKTGTTNDYRDAWFVGYTTRLVTGVWVGFDQPQTIMGRGYAATVAVPLWAGFMKRATAGDPNEWYRPPKNIVSVPVCRLSGKRPVAGCEGTTVYTEDRGYVSSSTVYNEYFVRGTEPEEYCPLHIYRTDYSRVAGMIGGAPPAPSPNRVGEIVAAPSPSESANPRDAARATAEGEQPEKKKKRGFWSRLFGIGKDDDDEEREKERREQEERRNRDPNRENDRDNEKGGDKDDDKDRDKGGSKDSGQEEPEPGPGGGVR
jgi:penicillin-binding protein 1A